MNHDREHLIAVVSGEADPKEAFEAARALRDEGHGRTVTYSQKVFIPVTTLCRDTCSYCTFAKPPGAGGMYLTADEVLAVARAGEGNGCTEALLTLGDRPEARWSQAREFLDGVGNESTISYVADLAGQISTQTALYPHANPGLMDESELVLLRPVTASMGLMLENVSPRLMEPGMPHHGCPDKDPGLRMATIESAGRQKVPFTTGILVGIGESPAEIVDSLLAIAEVSWRFGHIQEVIVQNFRAKADTRMRSHPEPVPEWFARVVAVARLILGPQMNLQVPPNLTERFEVLLDAGINDWGGVSPLTIDWVNPEAPWPHLDLLRERTEVAGFELRPRLPVYPEFLTAEWLDPAVLTKATAAVDERGHALAPSRAGAR